MRATPPVFASSISGTNVCPSSEDASLAMDGGIIAIKGGMRLQVAVERRRELNWTLPTVIYFQLVGPDLDSPRLGSILVKINK